MIPINTEELTDNPLYTSQRDEPIKDVDPTIFEPSEPVKFQVREPIIKNEVKEIEPISILSEEAVKKQIPVELIQEVSKPVKKPSFLDKIVLSIYQLIY